MNTQINFTGIDGKDYSFNFSLASLPQEEIPVEQYENLLKLNELSKKEFKEENDLVRFNHIFFEMFLKEFLLAYPDHILSKYFDPIEGITEEGHVKVARFLGNMKNIGDVMTQIKEALEWRVENGNENITDSKPNREKSRQINKKARKGYSDNNI